MPAFCNSPLQATLLGQAAKIGGAVSPATVRGKDMEDVVRPVQVLGLTAQGTAVNLGIDIRLRQDHEWTPGLRLGKHRVQEGMLALYQRTLGFGIDSG